MFCSISGEPCSDPVVSHTGYIFNRPLIEHHLSSQGPTCPISDEPLTKEDLIPIKHASPDKPASIAVIPKQPTATSIPSLLRSLQAEWDATMLEVHQVKVQNAQLRQELSRALYQHDAACRVVARLMSEKDTLSEEITLLKRHLRSGTALPNNLPETPVHQVIQPTTFVPTTDEMDVDASLSPPSPPPPPVTVSLPDDILQDFKSTNTRLMSTRKKRKTPDTVTPDKITTFTSTNVAEISHSGIASLASIPSLTNADITVLVARSASRGTLLIDLIKGSSSTLPGPLKQSAVAALAIIDSQSLRVMAALRDRLVMATPKAIITDIPAQLDGNVSHITIHPSGRYVMAATSTGVLALFRITDTNVEKLYQIEVSLPGSIIQVEFHPDGALVAVATTSRGVLVYSVTDGVEASQLISDEPEKNPITGVRFLENGWHLAVISGSQVSIWDLRKISINSKLDHPTDVSSVAGDYTGTYLAVGLTSGHVHVWNYASKQFSRVVPAVDESNDPIAASSISGLVWGMHAKSLFVTCAESKQVLQWGISEQE